MRDDFQTPGRRVLHEKLLALEQQAKRGGLKSRNEAMRIAQERAAYPKLKQLAPSAVSDWFKGMAPPEDFPAALGLGGGAP
ncbi:hypothetical protein [Streptomyces sp. NPDC017993]|uniref:hypothetical protein n=1 Tax=Streptomyces sp. NPDC017993 TaxID=3365027 RepID=UPI0037AF1F24